MKKDDMLEITIEDISSDGSGVGKADGFALFVKDTIPGDQVKVKIMKMKKLLAVVLTGVMAMSVLTGCADIKTRQIADQLEGMLKSVNTKATVSATNDAEDLAKKAAKAVQKDDVDFGGSDAVVVVGADESESTPAKKTEKAAITEALKLSETKDKYVWVLRFDTKNLKNADQAKKIFDKVKSIDNALNAVDNFEVTTKKDDKEETKTYKAMAGDKYEIGTETFSKGEGKDKTNYVMVVVTCKAVASTEEA